ncbi:MAG: hypothetical protein Q7T93_10720 [Methylobacterium sp.]|jgi:hypothetical protein|uniref:hypothetical protein n=1 Tax=unclassified Methylobacterium TaxID=2615210 RepID=UPI000B27B320|nr:MULTISPECIES: hypothetical protein [unclassified Methylobacterium]MDO9427293.1 hypothetical protein [Methylobacterium sp.]
MNELAILAFVVTPAIVVVMGYVAVRLHEAAGRRQARNPVPTSNRAAGQQGR